MEENMQHFCVFGILGFIISRKVKTNETHTKTCAVYGEGAVTDRAGQKWFASFVLEISRWAMILHS